MEIKIKREDRVPLSEAVQMIRDYISNLPPPKHAEFEVGEAVLLDTGWIGVVSSIDDEGCVCVCYIDDNGDIGGPAYGYSLTKFEV